MNNETLIKQTYADLESLTKEQLLDLADMLLDKKGVLEMVETHLLLTLEGQDDKLIKDELEKIRATVRGMKPEPKKPQEGGQPSPYQFIKED